MKIQPLSLNIKNKEDTLEFIEDEFDIEKYRIHPDQNIEIKPPVLIIEQNGEQFILMTEGSSSMLQGKAKSKKTTLLKGIAVAVSSGRFKNLISSYHRNQVGLVDTEQDEEDCWYSVRQIQALSQGKVIDYFSVPELSIEQRKKLVEEYLKSTPNCGLIILDNIAHFVKSFNSEEECAELIQWINKTKKIYKVHFLLILHENKSDGNYNAKGHLGTMLEQNCQTIIRLEEVKSDSRKSIVMPKAMRKRKFEKFIITFDQFGNPEFEDYDEDYYKPMRI